MENWTKRSTGFLSPLIDTRLWYKKLAATLVDMGFKILKSDSSVYILDNGSVRVILPVFVDNCILVSKSKAAIQEVKQKLLSHFKLRDLGPTSLLLGVAISRDRAKHSISLSQKHYVEDILERFHIALPQMTDEDKQAMASVPYINAVGALMYLAIATRPDISFAVSVLSRFNSNPGPDHWKAVKHLFRYLKGTMDHKLTYAPLSSASKERFEVYSDADHGGNPDSGKSTSAYVVKMGTDAVSWSSKLQSIVALFTTEAEQLLTELGYEASGPTTPHMNNQSVIQIARNPEHHYWLRDAVENRTLSIDYVPTDSMAADILTKSMSKVNMEEACKQLSLES
ncbi:hypothetical protein NLI96_g1951 [Meripilus lineatus]|uniref:Reverse transcriptase Ty1/copia-type domain-containing protein n=1 Tax=Meripilus lineatus TaxID=2056292 RepID=A0AAD5VBR6_9APHY|nr:hypothetical protein NLI96_g1951 [Physisporinus lineatus]